MDTKDLWLKYAEQLKGLVTAGMFDESRQVFSLAGTNLSVDLGNKDPEIVNSYIYQIGNTIPAYSPIYTPASSIITSYNIFLDSIDLGGDSNPNLDSQINKASIDLTQSQNNFLDVQSKAVTNWKNYKEIDEEITFQEYVARYYKVYIDAKKDLDAKRSKWNSLMVQRYGEGFITHQADLDKLGIEGGALDVLKQTPYNMPIKTGVIAPAGSTTTLPGQDAPDLPNTLKSIFAPSFNLMGFTAKYEEWQRASSEGKRSDGTISISGSSKSANMKELGWDASASALFRYGFFSLDANGAAKSTSLQCDSNQQNFNFEISFTGLNTFLINPGLWYDSGVVQAYHDKLRKGARKFFGPDGCMALSPYAIVVGFEPKIKLTLGSEDYHSFKSNFQASATASINIGPFRLGNSKASTYCSKESMNYEDSSNTITVGPENSTVPILLGVLSTKL